MNTSKQPSLKKLSFKSLFYQVGKWQVPTNKFEEPEAASIRTASWLQNYYVETMIDQPNRVIFKVKNMPREKNSPFNFINDGELTFRKVANAPYLEIDYRINMAKAAATLIFAPLNQAYALNCFKSILFEGLTKDPLTMPPSPEKLRLTKNELVFLYMLAAPIIAGLIEMIRLWQDLPTHPAIAKLFTDKNTWITADFWAAIFLPVALLCTWMIFLWVYGHDHRNTIRNTSNKNKQDFTMVIASILLLWISIIWTINQVYVNVSTYNFSSKNLPAFSLEYWMVGICLIWAIGFAYIFVKYFKE